MLHFDVAGNVPPGATITSAVLRVTLNKNESGTHAVYVYRVKRLPFGLGASLVAGAISGLLGVGGGIVKVPALNTFCGIPIRVAAATSAFMIGVTAAASSFIYWHRGDISPAISAAVALGALPAGLLGAHLSERIDAR